MKVFILIMALSNLLVLAETSAPAKKKISTNIYEEQKGESFTAKVRTFKESRGDTLVYFEEIKKSGPYVLSETIKDYSILKNRIAKSAKGGGPKVSVSIDDQDNILSVTIEEEP